MFTIKKGAKEHAKLHGELRWYCPRAEKEGCEMRFAFKAEETDHANSVHGPRRWPCPLAEKTGCTVQLTTEDSARFHAARVHGNGDMRISQILSEGFPCRRAGEFKCNKKFGSEGTADDHAKSVHSPKKWLCPLAEERGRPRVFSHEGGAKIHAKDAHGDMPIQQKNCPWPRATEEDCSKMYYSRAGAYQHAQRKHGKVKPDKTFIAAWPKLSRNVALKGADGNAVIQLQYTQRWRG